MITDDDHSSLTVDFSSKLSLDRLVSDEVTDVRSKNAYLLVELNDDTIVALITKFKDNSQLYETEELD